VAGTGQRVCGHDSFGAAADSWHVARDGVAASGGDREHAGAICGGAVAAWVVDGVFCADGGAAVGVWELRVAIADWRGRNGVSGAEPDDAVDDGGVAVGNDGIVLPAAGVWD